MVQSMLDGACMDIVSLLPSLPYERAAATAATAYIVEDFLRFETFALVSVEACTRN